MALLGIGTLWKANIAQGGGGELILNNPGQYLKNEMFVELRKVQDENKINAIATS